MEPEQLAFEDLELALDQATFLVVDVETTGEKPGLHSLTEIGAVKVRGGEVIGEFQSLINPGVPIPAFIARLTGITNAMVATAPPLAQVMISFIEFIGHDPELIYVAHNARFDIGQLSGAAQAINLQFPKRATVDTVKLARRVFTRDEVPNYKLASLARFVGAHTTPIHRALDDARATVDVLHGVLSRLGSVGVTHVNDLLTAHSSVPNSRRRKASLADELPKGCGVYQFIGPNNEILYIGVSANIYRRVRSYFTAAEKRRRINEMVDLACRVEAIPTATVLEAQILEIRLIRDITPWYNKRSRPRARYWVGMTNEAHPRLKVTTVAPGDQLRSLLGPFTRRSAAHRAKELLESVSRLRTCSDVLPAQPDGRPSCHMEELGLCDAPCRSGIMQRQSVDVVSQALQGNLDYIHNQTMKKMESLAHQERFEAAQGERECLYALVEGAVAHSVCVPLIEAGRIIAAAPAVNQPNTWEVIVVDHGRFRESHIFVDENAVRRFATEFVVANPLAPLPQRPFDAVSTDELRCVSQWLWRDGVRIIAVTHPEKLSTAVTHARKITLPTLAGSEHSLWDI